MSGWLVSVGDNDNERTETNEVLPYLAKRHCLFPIEGKESFH